MTDKIKSLLVFKIDDDPERGEYWVGFNGVTKIEKYEENGMACMIPYIRVWKGDKVHAEFCKHNIIGVQYDK